MEVNDAMAKKIQDDLVSGRPSSMYQIGPLTVRASSIRMVQNDDYERKTFKRGIDLSDPAKREEVKQFEREFNEFLSDQPNEKQTFEHYLVFLKVIHFSKAPQVAQGGYERFSIGSMLVHDYLKYDELFQKHSALADLQVRRAYAETKELEGYDKILPQISPDDEINVTDIPF